MGKKKSIKIDLRVVISLAAVLISLLSLAFLSLEAVNLKLKVGSGLIQLSSYSLVEVIFGNADRRIEGSTLLLIAFILIIVGSIFDGLYFKCKYAAFVGGVCNLFASICFYLTVASFLGVNSSLNINGNPIANTVSSIGVGAILVATFNLVSSLVMLGLGFEGVRK